LLTERIGSDYRAVRRLSDRANVTLAEAGETCDKVPVESLAPLLASGHIEPVRQAERVESSDALPAAPDDEVA
jgi:hypothetical protein